MRSSGETAPHPASAKLDDVSPSLRNPLPASRGEGEPKLGEETLGTSDEDLATNEAFILDIRDRLLTIPGVREFAREWGLDARPRLHSACNSSAPESPTGAPQPAPGPSTDPGEESTE
jgi:hypothetical protein